MNPSQNGPELPEDKLPSQPASLNQPQIIKPGGQIAPNNPPTPNTNGPAVQPTQSPSAIPSSPPQSPSPAPHVDTAALFQPDKPGANPFGPDPSRTRRRRILLGGAAALAVLVLGLGWVLAFYLPNKPQNVWKTGLDRTGSTIDKLVVSSTEKDKLEQVKKSELSGSLEINGDGVNFKGSFSSKYNTKSSNNNLDVQYDSGDGAQNKINAQVLSDIPDGSELPNIYFKLSGLNAFGIDQLMPELAGYEGKWISVSSEYLKTVIPPEERANLKKDQQNSLTTDDVAQLARAVSSTTQEYVFSSDTSKSVLVQKRFIGVEKLDGGITGYHYEVGFNKSNVVSYCKAMVNNILAVPAYKKIPGVDPDNIEKDKKSALKECDDSKKDVDENYSFDMWIDKKYKLIHKLRFSDEKDKGSYMEVGQTYKGDDILPLFVTFHSDKEKYDAKLTLDVNTKESATKGAFDLSYNGEQQYKIKASFEFKPYGGEINVEKPAGAIPIEEVFKKIGFNPVGVSEGINSKAGDTSIKADINALYSNLEIFFAQSGYYPSLAQINSESWRKANMRGLDDSILKGPNNSATGLAAVASSTQYGYTPSGCNSAGEKCTAFVLTGLLSSGQKFEKTGSNN